MTDELPPGDVRECPACGAVLIIDSATNTVHHAAPACPESLELARATGARALGPHPFCYVCKRTDRELRLYGKGRRPICFPCIESDPERQREARKWMRRALKRAGPVPAIIEGVGIISSDEAMRRGLPVQFVDTKTGQVLPRGAKG